MVILKQYIKSIVSFLRTCLWERQEQESIKLKASTLIESLVASVIIVIIFTIASLTLNNVFRGSVNSNQDRIQNRLNTLAYQFANDKVQYPYQENFEKWKIQLIKSKQHNGIYFVLEAKQVTENVSKKVILKKLTYVTVP